METVLSFSVIAQVFGVVGMLGGMTWALFPTRIGMLATQLIANLLFALHYWMIGAHTGAVMNVLSALQAAAAIPLGEHPRFRYVYLALLPVIGAGMIMTWHGGPSVFAACATVIISIGRYQTRVVPFRVLMAVALPCWFGHNFWVQSYPGMTSDICGMLINSYMLYRLIAEGTAVAERA